MWVSFFVCFFVSLLRVLIPFPYQKTFCQMRKTERDAERKDYNEGWKWNFRKRLSCNSSKLKHSEHQKTSKTFRDRNVVFGVNVEPLLSSKSSKHYIFWVCVCSLRYLACKVHEPCCIVICGLSRPSMSPPPSPSPTISHKRHNFQEQKYWI
jgi:hypothetical protein